MAAPECMTPRASTLLSKTHRAPRPFNTFSCHAAGGVPAILEFPLLARARHPMRGTPEEGNEDVEVHDTKAFSARGPCCLAPLFRCISHYELTWEQKLQQTRPHPPPAVRHGRRR